MNSISAEHPLTYSLLFTRATCSYHIGAWHLFVLSVVLARFKVGNMHHRVHATIDYKEASRRFLTASGLATTRSKEHTWLK